MPNNVVTLGTGQAEAANPDGPDEELIEILEYLLERAKAGAVHDYSLVYLDRVSGGDVVTSTRWNARNSGGLKGVSAGMTLAHWEIAQTMFEMTR